MNENNPLVCVIDDESSIRESLSSLLRSAGLKVQAFSSAQEFLASAPLEALSCLVLDVRLPGISGLDLQQELASKDIQIPIIFLTGHGDIPMSVRAIKAGAIEFLTKPFDDEYLLEAIRSAIARDNKNERSPGRMAKERFEERIGTDRASRAVLNQPEIVISSRLNGNGKAAVAFGEIIGQSRAWRQITKQIEMVAPTDATVLVLGETGTGKELIARELHRRSRRRLSGQAGKFVIGHWINAVGADCMPASRMFALQVDQAEQLIERRQIAVSNPKKGQHGLSSSIHSTN